MSARFPYGHLYADVVVNTESEIRQHYDYSQIPIYFHKSLVNNGVINIREYAYFYGDIENNGTWLNNTSMRLAWEGDENTDYEFVMGTDHDNMTTIQSVQGNFYNDPSVISAILDTGVARYWKVRPVAGEWSEIHTINVPLYLETQENFFTVTDIPNTTQKIETEITITSTDPTYSGDISLSVPTGSVTPNILHIEDGILTTHISFDTVQENISLSMGSNNHNTLRGKSNEFNILHTIQNSFFTIPAVIEAQTERTLVIPLSAEDTDYTGRVLITYYYRNQQGIEESIALPELDIQQGQATFSYTPQFFSTESYFTFVDKDKDYLRGRSLPFLVKKKKKRHGGSVSSQHVSEVFFGQSDDGQEIELNDEDDEIEIDLEPNDEHEEENEESEEERVIELSNECLNIESIFKTFSFGQRRVLKSIPKEKQNVKNLQQKLKDLHFLSGNVDGDFGNKTKQALKDFQEQNNLFVDGVFGNGSSQFIDNHCTSLKEKEIQIDDEEELNTEEDNAGNDDSQNQDLNQPNQDQGFVDGIVKWFNSVWWDIRNALGLNEDEKKEVFKDIVEIKKEIEKQEENYSPVGDAPITSLYMSDRSDCSVCSNTHGGTDYAVVTGTPIRTLFDGVVVRSYYSRSFGNTLIIKHNESKIEGEILYTLYAHGSEILVEKDNLVSKDEVIMLSGRTGRGTGPHLHYEVISSPYHVFDEDFFFKDKFNHRYGPSEIVNLINK